jgi:UPF0755 protein
MKTKKTRVRHRSIFASSCLGILVILLILVVGLFTVVPVMAVRSVGPVSDRLSVFQRFQYSAMMLWYEDLVTRSVDIAAGERPFTIEAGEGPAAVAARLELEGIIRSADAFTTYLVYSGLDTGMQAGKFQLSPATPPIQIAQKLQDATPAQIKFVVLPGWRLEEIAAAMPTSGLNIAPQQLIQSARAPDVKYDYLPPGSSAEGFLFPGEYTLPRSVQADELVSLLMNNTALALTVEIRAGFSRQNLNVYEAVTLASIIQREAVIPEEQPSIASVFINRINAGMRLETDPTIQYALGFDPVTGSWWKVPLSAEDLLVNSPYNTYQNFGLPPGPISNPSLSALQAVAYPAQTPYYFFRARCDGSGFHNFSETFNQHLRNGCP